MPPSPHQFQALVVADDRQTNPAATIRRDRLRDRRSGGRTRLSVNLTSLIDVTFLLLIYFMVATSIAIGEAAYRMDLPNREGLGALDPFELDDQPLQIAVISTGLRPEMYRVQLDGPYPQPADAQALYQFLVDKQVDSAHAGDAGGGSGALFEKDHPIIIQPSATTLWEHAIEVFNAAARARYTNVTFAKPD